MVALGIPAPKKNRPLSKCCPVTELVPPELCPSALLSEPVLPQPETNRQAPITKGTRYFFIFTAHSPATSLHETILYIKIVSTPPAELLLDFNRKPTFTSRRGWGLCKSGSLPWSRSDDEDEAPERLADLALQTTEPLREGGF